MCPCVRWSGSWQIKKPALFKPVEMIGKAIAQIRCVNSDPMIMGRNAGAYDALRIHRATLMEVMRDMTQSVKQ
jgi:hypothetical protein